MFECDTTGAKTITLPPAGLSYISCHQAEKGEFLLPQATHGGAALSAQENTNFQGHVADHRTVTRKETV